MEVVELTSDVDGTRFHKNDRQRGFTTSYNYHYILWIRALRWWTRGELGLGFHPTKVFLLRPTLRSPSNEKGCFSLSERWRSFRCLGDPVHRSIHLPRKCQKNATALLRVTTITPKLQIRCRRYHHYRHHRWIFILK